MPPPSQTITERTTQSTATASIGVAGAFVVILTWVLAARWEIQVPGEVAAAFLAILTPAVHYLGLYVSGPPSPPNAKVCPDAPPP